MQARVTPIVPTIRIVCETVRMESRARCCQVDSELECVSAAGFGLTQPS